MSHVNRHRQGEDFSEGDLERRLWGAMCVHGSFLPVTPEEVQRAEEQEDVRTIQLPERMRDPYRVLDEIDRAVEVRIVVPPATDLAASQNLAQAARDGKEIPSDVLAKMRADREAAEREQDNAK